MKILKTLASAALIITFITGVWFIDDRYVDAKEIKDIKEQINLRIDTYEYRELTKQYYELKKLIRENGIRVDYLVDYHTRLRMMIEVVTTEKNLKDIFDIVDEAQRRLRKEDEQRKIRN